LHRRRADGLRLNSLPRQQNGQRHHPQRQLQKLAVSCRSVTAQTCVLFEFHLVSFLPVAGVSLRRSAFPFRSFQQPPSGPRLPRHTNVRARVPRKPQSVSIDLERFQSSCALAGNVQGAIFLIRQLNTVWVPHPFPRILRERVGSNDAHFLPDQ